MKLILTPPVGDADSPSEMGRISLRADFSVILELNFHLICPSYGEVTIRTASYYHILDGKADIIEWYKGSGLRPYLQALNEKEQKEFLADLENIIDRSYQQLDDGKVFLIMPRLFFIPRK